MQTSRIAMKAAALSIVSAVITYPRVARAVFRAEPVAECAIVWDYGALCPINSAQANSSTHLAGTADLTQTYQGELINLDTSKVLELACPIEEDDYLDVTTGTVTLAVYGWANSFSSTTYAQACYTNSGGAGGQCGFAAYAPTNSVYGITPSTSIWQGLSTTDGFYVHIYMAHQDTSGSDTSLFSMEWYK